MRNEQPVRRRKTDTERQRSAGLDKKVRRNSGNGASPVKERKQEPQRRTQVSSPAAQRRRAARIKQMRRKKVIRILLLILLVASLLAGAGAAVFIVRKTFFRGPYKSTAFLQNFRIPGSPVRKERQPALRQICVWFLEILFWIP